MATTQIEKYPGMEIGCFCSEKPEISRRVDYRGSILRFILVRFCQLRTYRNIRHGTVGFLYGQLIFIRLAVNLPDNLGKRVDFDQGALDIVIFSGEIIVNATHEPFDQFPINYQQFISCFNRSIIAEFSFDQDMRPVDANIKGEKRSTVSLVDVIDMPERRILVQCPSRLKTTKRWNSRITSILVNVRFSKESIR